MSDYVMSVLTTLYITMFDTDTVKPRSVVVSMMRCYAGDLGSIPGRVETLGSVSATPCHYVKIVPANVREDSMGVQISADRGMFSIFKNFC